MALRLGRERRIVLVQGPHSLTCVWRTGRRFVEHTIELPDGLVSEHIVKELRQQCLARGAPARARVSIVLRGEQARVRTIELPARDSTVAIRVLQNEPRRYFPVSPGRYAISAVPLKAARGSTQYLAAAVPDEFVGIWPRTLTAGWRCAEVVPAGSALLLGGKRVFSRKPALENVPDLNLEGLKVRRRWKKTSLDVRLAVTAHAAPQADFAQIGVEPRSSRRARRVARVLTGFALILLAANAPLELWGLKREAAHLEAGRAQRKADVANTERARLALERMHTAADTVARVLGNNGRTGQFLVELATSLPLDTHVLSMRLTGDTVLVELAGPSAAATMRKLQETPRFGAVRLAGPVKREGRGGNPAMERFKVMATTAGTRKEAS